MVEKEVHLAGMERRRCDHGLTLDIFQGVRDLLGEEGEVVEEEGFTEVEVGVVEEEVEADMMEVEGEVSVVVAVSTGELSRSHFRASKKEYLVNCIWKGGGRVQYIFCKY